MTKEEIAARLRALADEIDGTVFAGIVDIAPTPAPAKPITLEQVRAALTQLASDKGAAQVKTLLKDFGADKLSDIAAQDFAELLAKAEEMGK
jgi:hypothetical protein